MKNIILIVILSLSMISCGSGNKSKTDMTNQKEQQVKIETSLGDIVVKLYNDTPEHRDNFIKLAKEGTYAETLFHRVIKNFMIQAGDPDSKNAPKDKMLGAGDVGYTLPAEFVYPKYFHKKGALSAARQSDQVNPKKESSGCQFYIVTGEVYSDSTLMDMQKQMNSNKMNIIFNKLAQGNMQKIYALQMEKNHEGLMDLQNELIAQAEAMAAEQPDFEFTSEQKEAYTTLGGTPHLDNEYTVFGEVVSGLEVVDSIQNVATDENDRPIEDVVVTSIKINK